MSNKLVIFDEVQHKVLKIRIYPNQDQVILINKTFGSCRKLYNEHLQERNEFYIDNILPIPKEERKAKSKEIYKNFKPKTEKEWKVIYPYMKEVSSCALQQARMDCDQAFVNFFKSNNGSRKGKSGFPKFKSKHNNHQSYREVMVDDSYLNFEERKVKIPKVGKVSFKDRKFPIWWERRTKLCSMTVEKNCSNQYFVAILFEVQKAVHKIDNRKDAIGMDFSPAEMYINSDGLSGKDFGYAAQKQAHHKQLKKLSKRLAKKQKGSNNRNKARIKLARLEEHIANSRKDWIEKESLRLVRSYEKVVVEDLNLKGISKFLRNAKNMNDTSWATFVSRLQAKGEDYNCKVIKADRYFPSSKLCSCCGWKYENLTLDIRKWTCTKCGTSHIRDVNAAINLKNYVPMEGRELTPVESDKVKSLALLALQVGSLNEAGNHSQATSGRNVLGLQPRAGFKDEIFSLAQNIYIFDEIIDKWPDSYDYYNEVAESVGDDYDDIKDRFDFDQLNLRDCIEFITEHDGENIAKKMFGTIENIQKSFEEYDSNEDVKNVLTQFVDYFRDDLNEYEEQYWRECIDSAVSDWNAYYSDDDNDY